MDLKLQGKRALVTGSTTGIGEGIALTLAAEGAKVVVHGRNAEAAAAVQAAIRSAGGEAAVAIGDLSSDLSALKVADEARSAFGGIDILVNNAGVYDQVGWMESSTEKWSRMFNTDLLSMVRLIQALAPDMQARGWGRLIQISSVAAVQPYDFGPDYSAVKAGVDNLTVSLSKHLANSGVNAVTITPGPIMTKGFEELWRAQAAGRNWGESWEEIEAGVVRDVLPNAVGRVGRVEEVAALVALVASPLGGYINGANLRVDGGYVIGV
ncbi:SDR family NAD(P)-dependent oxidoreductase [Ensifer adhaerens]|uniref:SDR family NAD(P)-dependent oxidoreductase n=1 Tax=Ensifer adhaerens TaxID=106592 RepID=UPI000DC45131|nr:SDR family NAD(P)-dependent oxidoreductase [Ensifer adhaerens]RAR98760.1 NAD(P)-dependent dehydrogenase (short-subunit alcohol dehydrogenase family) [Ensifer adhaerens]